MLHQLKHVMVSLTKGTGSPSSFSAKKSTWPPVLEPGRTGITMCMFAATHYKSLMDAVLLTDTQRTASRTRSVISPPLQKSSISPCMMTDNPCQASIIFILPPFSTPNTRGNQQKRNSKRCVVSPASYPPSPTCSVLLSFASAHLTMVRQTRQHPKVFHLDADRLTITLQVAP